MIDRLHMISYSSCGLLDIVAFVLLCFPRLLELMWCSFAVNLLVVTGGGGRDRSSWDFTLSSYGDGVCGVATVPRLFPV